MNQEILACSGPGLDDLNEFYENNPHGEALNAILLDELNVLLNSHSHATPWHGGDGTRSRHRRASFRTSGL
jgi:hypothetical protein